MTTPEALGSLETPLMAQYAQTLLRLSTGKNPLFWSQDKPVTVVKENKDGFLYAKVYKVENPKGIGGSFKGLTFKFISFDGALGLRALSSIEGKPSYEEEGRLVAISGNPHYDLLHALSRAIRKLPVSNPSSLT